VERCPTWPPGTADAKPDNPGWFLIATDADGDGVEETSTVVSFTDIFRGL
jgi:hypothetical protein